jgi:hypothetical protein
MENELLTAYSATFISISGRFVFMYLLYTKKSTNLYSLLFSIMNIVSSSLWITYSQMISDRPLLHRPKRKMRQILYKKTLIFSFQWYKCTPKGIRHI